MRTLHLYLTRQVLATLLMTVTVFAFVLLLGNVLKEIIVLLINRQATLGGVAEAIGLLIPFVLVFALPMGMLTAALLVFGRFSADQELTAVRSSGISLVALITPILCLSLFLCVVSAWINMEVAPQCRVAYKQLLYEMGMKMGGTALPEGRFVKLPGYIIYVGKNDGQNLQDVSVYQLDSEQKFESFTKAPRGRLETTNQLTTLTLYDAQGVGKNGEIRSGDFHRELECKQSNPADQKPSLSDMTFRELQAELKDLEQRFSKPNSRGLTFEELHNQMSEFEKQRQDMTMPVRVQIHRQVAFSFACFGFTLVGIPLGIRAHRRETNVGIAMALGLVLIYYSFVILGQSLQTRAEWAPYLIVWLPNFIFQS